MISNFQVQEVQAQNAFHCTLTNHKLSLLLLGIYHDMKLCVEYLDRATLLHSNGASLVSAKLF